VGLYERDLRIWGSLLEKKSNLHPRKCSENAYSVAS